ncbi:MAG: ABC transporter ATP-binding protein [Buchananella hordeovulneris]|nr:ABC transporter ATP-binding protein [Buchananella hordeovulneris]
MSVASPLRAERLVAGYGSQRPILDGVELSVLAGELTVIVGPNACGKSTLLRALARVLPCRAGRVLLDGTDIRAQATKAVARRVGMLPQSSQAPEEILVADLVARGRYPHQGMLRQWSREDEAATRRAMEDAGVSELADRRVGQLSGGQRQRVWIAMALAQETDLLLLDEPTTYLDLAHQLEVLELARGLRAQGRTVVAVLHDLHLAFRYATHLVVMRGGAVVAQGEPRRVVTPELIKEVYGVECTLIPDPQTGTPIVIPTERS